MADHVKVVWAKFPVEYVEQLRYNSKADQTEKIWAEEQLKEAQEEIDFLKEDLAEANEELKRLQMDLYGEVQDDD